MNKKFAFLGVFAVSAILMAALALPMGIVSADTTDTNDTFITKLAEKLGISESDVRSAVDSVRDEIRSEKDSETKNKISEAVINGTLTNRQADILNALIDNRVELAIGERPDLSGLTREERRLQMETFRSEREQKEVDLLNKAGLETSLEEVREAKEAAKSADIMMGFGRRGHGGLRGL